MIDLKYSLVIEATNDPTFLVFTRRISKVLLASVTLLKTASQARWGMEEHLELLKKQSLPIPNENPDPKIVIQNQEPLAQAS